MKENYGFKKCLSAFLLISLLFCTITAPVSAAPQESYTYDAWDEEIPTPVSYTVSKSVVGTDLGVGKLNEPSDIFVDDDNNIYVSDTGNNRVLKISSDFKTVYVISSIVIDGEIQPIEAPGGLFVDNNGDIFITQKEKNRVLKLGADGAVKEI